MDFQPYEAHPYANIFPLREGPELWALADDIAANGQAEKIVLYEGKVLDGRRRQLGCLRAKVQPEYEEFDGTNEEALEFVMSKNLHRRHLGEAERAMAAAAYATAKAGFNQHSRSSQNATTSPTNKEAAEVFGTTEAKVDRAKKVLAKGSKKLKQAVAGETVSISDAAKIADEPKAVQTEAVKRVEAGEAKTLAKAVEQTKAEAEPKKKPARDELKDKVGNVLPDSCRDAFTDATLPSLIDTLKAVEADFAIKAWLNKAKKLIDHYPFLLLAKFNEHTYDAQASLQLAIEALESGVPHAVCPKCKGIDSKASGKICASCRGCGHVPITRYQELTA